MEAAQAMALRILREGGTDDAQRADYAFHLCTAREPLPAERDEILALLQSRRQRLADGWLDIRVNRHGRCREATGSSTSHDTPRCRGLDAGRARAVEPG